MRTLIGRSRVTRPDPRQLAQGRVMTRPAPPQRGHVRAIVKNPCW
jgi:hypothetical protein